MMSHFQSLFRLQSTRFMTERLQAAVFVTVDRVRVWLLLSVTGHDLKQYKDTLCSEKLANWSTAWLSQGLLQVRKTASLKNSQVTTDHHQYRKSHGRMPAGDSTLAEMVILAVSC